MVVVVLALVVVVEEGVVVWLRVVVSGRAEVEVVEARVVEGG